MRGETNRSVPADRPGIAAYDIVPAAGFHFLTPCFDLVAGITGVGRAFKERAVALAGITDGIRVLDLGCGSGLAALLVKERFPRCRVIGVDPDPRILGIARRRVEKAQVRGIEFVCARAEETGLDATSIDAVLCLLAFHHVPPRGKQEAAREMARVLRPGGTVLIVDLRPLSPYRRELSDDERKSPRAGRRSNTPSAVSAALAGAGLSVTEERSPGGGLFARWIFALRGQKLERLL
jgi:ubiquinone/menaquinone biosynthesis C-methylase UbiE